MRSLLLLMQLYVHLLPIQNTFLTQQINSSDTVLCRTTILTMSQQMSNKQVLKCITAFEHKMYDDIVLLGCDAV
jgi:hypothetical protein